MKKTMLKKISTILGGLGIMIILLAISDMLPGWRGALLFAGTMCFVMIGALYAIAQGKQELKENKE